MPNQQHALRISRITDTTINPTDSAPRFQPRCMCGWVGDETAERGEARDRATLHVRNAVLAEIMP